VAINLFVPGRTGPATPELVPQDKLTLVMVGFVAIVSASPNDEFVTPA
jgi:hypothetical protein